MPTALTTMKGVGAIGGKGLGDNRIEAGAAGARRSAFRGALLTLLLIEAAVTIIYILDMLLLGRFPAGTIVRTAVLMIGGDALLDIPLVILLFASSRWRGGARWSIVVAGTVAVTIVQSFWDTEVRTWTGMRTLYGSYHDAVVRALPVNFYASAMLVLLLAFQSAYFSIRAQRAELDAAYASERATHLAALRFQLNPHFMFNALNALSSLVVLRRVEQADDMIARLSDFLRSTLLSSTERGVRLEDEFDTLEAYLEIERIRFGERLNVVIDLPAALRGARVPPFLLQPLVENAVKYGVSPSRRAVMVAIAAGSAGGMLELAVRDDGENCESVPGGTGVGLTNIRERLRLSYGGRARLETKCGDEGGFEAVIRIPIADAAPA